jgi:hypothetical protein
LIVRLVADSGIRVGELLARWREDLRANTTDRKYWVRVIGEDEQRDVPIPVGLYRRLSH